MINLLNAGITRLKKTKVFWLLIIFSISIALFIIYAGYNDMKHFIIKLDQLLLNYSTMIGIVIAIFTSLFLGAEYSTGALRNKISIGHKRTNIYLSNLIIITITSLFSYILFMIVIISIGVPLFGNITIPISELLVLIGCVFITILAYAGIFTFIALIISNKTITAITSIMLAFILMIYSISAYDRLNQPEYINQMIIKQDTGERVTEITKNPRYLTGIKKKFVQLSLDINPTGQILQIIEKTAPNLKVLPIYSILILIVFTSTGLILFKKKELK